MPLGMIAEGTEAVMAEKGIFLEGHFSKGVNEVPLKKMDVIVTMGCGMPCPTFPGFRGRKVEWEIPDPYGHSLKYFRQVRDLLEGQVRALLENPACTGALRRAARPPEEHDPEARVVAG